MEHAVNILVIDVGGTLIIHRLIEAIHPDDIVLGGVNAKKLKQIPAGCRLGENSFAFVGGFRLWEPFTEATSTVSQPAVPYASTTNNLETI